MTIKTKLFFSFFFIAVIASLTATFFAIYVIHNRYENIARQQNIASRKIAENVFYENLGDLSRKVTFLAELKEISGGIAHPDELSLAVEAKVFFLLNLNLKIMDKSHNLLVDSVNSSTSFLDGEALRSLPFFQSDRDPLLRDAGIFQLPKGTAIVSYSPIVDQESFELKGFLLLELPLNSVLADEMKDKTKSDILIICNNREVASTFMDINGSRYFPRLDVPSPGQVSRARILSNTCLVDYFPIRDFNNRPIGRIYVSVDIQAIIEAKRIGIYGMVLVFLVVLALVSIGSMWTGSRLSQPLRNLSHSAEAVARGDFDVRIEAAGNDEIGNTARVFNNMVVSLKNQREEMSRLRMHLQSIIDSMPSILIGVDAQGRVTQWNQEAARMTGISQTVAMGQSLSKVFPFIMEEALKIGQAMAQRKPQKVERVSVSIGQQVHHFDIVVYPLLSPGLDGAVIRVDDVSARIRIETMMIQTEKMLSVGGLAAGMAHEINNPLGGILQGTQNILRRLSPDLPKNREAAAEAGTGLEQIHAYLEKREILRFLDGIRESGERAAGIVENMLSFSRRSDSRQVPERLETILDKTIQLAANDYDLKKRYDFRHIRIVREFATDLPPVPCVATEIQQVVLNLLKNAAQALFDHPDPRRQPRITLRLQTIPNAVRIEVADNGPGMSESVLKRIFEPFFTTKEVGIGTGLGLSVSYFIVTNNHKGTMEVESTPDVGTTFIITLPTEERPA